MTKTDIGTASVSDGTASTSYTVPSDAVIGDHTLIATYQENSLYQEGTGSNSFKIRKPTKITVQDAIGSIGETITLTANVYYDETNPVSGGQVQFVVDGSNVGSQVTVSNGVATVSYTVASTVSTGAIISANYLGNETYATCSNELNGTLYIRGDPTIQVSNLSVNRGDTVEIPVTVTNSDGDPIDGTIQFYLDGTVINNSITVSNGSATLQYNVSTSETIGGHTIKVVYVKNDDYNSAEATATMTVRTPTTVVCNDISGNPGETISITVTVTDPSGQPIPSGTARFTLPSGATIDATVDSTGIATTSYPISEDANGQLEFSAVYLENTNYQAGSSTVNGVITIRESITITVPDSITCKVGETVTVTATVTSGSTPVTTGNVTFTLETST